MRDVLNGVLNSRVDASGLYSSFPATQLTASEFAAGITPVNYAYPPRELGPRYGLIADGTTDNTSAILTICNAMSGWYIIPYNVLYDRKTLIAGLDPDVILLDMSQINDLTSAGETTKNIGIVTSDIATDDATWAIQSGHHPSVLLNNFRSSGTASATAGVASLVWASGMFQNAGLTKRGSRGCATMQFTKDPGGNFWTWRLTLNAPWLAIAGAYEDWVAGEVIAVGTYRRNSGAHYVSTNTGTTAAAGPSHTSGTAADGGGVIWFFLDSADQGLYQIDEFGRILIGSDAINFTFEHRPRNVDPAGGNYSMMLKGTGVTKTAELRLGTTDGAGADVAQPYLKATTSTGLQIIRADGANAMMTWLDSAGVTISNHSFAQAPSGSSPATGNNGTITTASLGASKVTPAGAITGVILQAGTRDGQECTVLNQSGSSITFAAYATSHVAQGVGCVIAGTTSRRFVWDSVAAAWY